jgi:hypothetical protein
VLIKSSGKWCTISGPQIGSSPKQNYSKFIVFSHASFNNLPLTVNIDFNNFSGQSVNELITPIDFVNQSQNPTIKFLGVLFDPAFNFKAHISSVSSKIS